MVVVEGCDPVGILTDRDLALALAEEVEHVTVGDLMTPHPLAIQLDTDVESCLDRMAAFHVRRMLIVDDDALVGVVSLDDILVHLGALMAKASALIESEVAGAKALV